MHSMKTSMPSCDRALLQGADHLQAGAVADVGEPGVAVAAEVALRDQAVVGAVEERAPVLELHAPARAPPGRAAGPSASC